MGDHFFMTMQTDGYAGGEMEFRAFKGLEQVISKFNADIDRQIAGALSDDYIHQLGNPENILLSTGISNLPAELSARQLK